MRVRRVEGLDPALEQVRRILVGPGPASGLDVSPRDGVLLFAGVIDEEPVCAGLFQDYRFPGLHLGNHLDPGEAGDLLERPDVGLYQVALLRSDEDRITLQDAAAALIHGFEDWATARFARTGLLITLLQQGNRRAVPLYRRLGFHTVGRPSRLMQFPLPAVPDLPEVSQPLPDELRLVFIEDADVADLRGLDACYRAVFLRGEEAAQWNVSDLLGPGNLGAGFSPAVSAVLRDPEGGVQGFMLADLAVPGTLHIHAAGLVPELRGRRLPARCIPAITRRARSAGATTAQFVTAQPRVDRLARRALRARGLDRLQLHLKIL